MTNEPPKIKDVLKEISEREKDYMPLSIFYDEEIFSLIIEDNMEDRNGLNANKENI